ncbi:hypothetical protein FMS18_00910 [Desulfovibrio sp. JC022]|nr:hypothetical protein [Desulfovibrio sp. JC022]
MRMAELELEQSETKLITVFVTFNISSLVDTNDPLQFYHWMLAKTLKLLLNKLRKKGLTVSDYAASLLSNDNTDSQETVEETLRQIVKKYEISYKEKAKIDISSLPDIEDVKDAIETLCEIHSLERVYFFFDEAAHVFRPEQQRQFFNFYKDLRSPYITCNAAIYPGVTYFGDSFEPTHDCTLMKLERNMKDSDYLSYFYEIVDKQADTKTKEAINGNIELFNTLALSCGGTPRMLLKTLQDIDKYNKSNIDKVLKTFYRAQVWAEHSELGDKFKGHKPLIDWGRDFLENNVIPAIESYNGHNQDDDKSKSTINFWIQKDAPEAVKESLRLLSYTGIIRKIDSTIRATRGKLGARYEVKYGCILSLDKHPASASKDFFNSLQMKNCPEFGNNHSSYDGIKDLQSVIQDDKQYQNSLKEILKKSIHVLPLLTDWQKSKLKEANILTIGQLLEAEEKYLIDNIYYIGPYKARYMKNAADAELLEYLSG